MEQASLALLDRPEILSLVFYPRREWCPPPPGAVDHRIPVAAGVSISARFYPGPGADAPTILFFHGNGEVACDYDGIAPLYERLGLGLFVADYRGYGVSGGSPTISALLADAQAILAYLVSWHESQGHHGPLFVMGRSLGSQPAIELASRQPGALRGLIIESGFASPLHLLRYFGLPLGLPQLSQIEAASQARLHAVTLPALIIHGQRDELIPADEGQSLYDAIGSARKRLVIVPRAGHNDLLMVGAAQYFNAITEFVFGEQPE